MMQHFDYEFRVRVHLEVEDDATDKDVERLIAGVEKSLSGASYVEEAGDIYVTSCEQIHPEAKEG